MTVGFPPVALLAGGVGTRIRTLAGTTPKVLLPVEGRPFLGHVLDFLAEQGVSQAVLCLGHEADLVWEAAQKLAPRGFICVASREEVPLGTGGALRRALPHLGPTFFIMNGDTFLDVSLATLLDFHRETRALLTLSVVRSEDPAERGSLRVAPGGRVLDFAEKTAEGTGLVNGGVYVAEADLVAGWPEDRPYSLEREGIPEALARGERVMSILARGLLVDIGLPETYLRVRDRLPRLGGHA